MILTVLSAFSNDNLSTASPFFTIFDDLYLAKTSEYPARNTVPWILLRIHKRIVEVPNDILNHYIDRWLKKNEEINFL